MMYPLMTLNGETEIVHSDMKEEGSVNKWEDISHFSEEDGLRHI